jgi:hypothetical protein
MNREGVVAQLGPRGWLARLFLVTLALTVLAYGSASQVESNLASIAFAVIAMLSGLHPIGASRVRGVQFVAILLLAGLLGYAALQALPFPGGEFANGAWKSIAEEIGPVQATISIAPGVTFESLPSLALPFLVFVSALALFQGDDEALLLLQILAYFGVAYAFFGIMQELFLPEQLLFEPKKYYVGYLTATFVNRNTAGTFFGIAFVLNLGLGFQQLRKIHLGSFTKKALNFDIGWRDKNALVLIHALFCLITAVALFLTQSRGAVGATFVSCVLAVVLMSTRQLTVDKPNENFVRWRRYPPIAGSVVAIVGLFALFAGRSMYRMQAQGTEDARWCSFASTIEAIKDNWVLGAGFGAFQDVFPVYRNSDCVGIFKVWDRAHDFFLEGYLGLGLPFIAALAIGYMILIGVFIRGMRIRHKYRFVPIAGLAVLVLVSLHSIVDFSLQIPGVGVYFAAVTAATVAVSLEARRRVTANSASGQQRTLDAPETFER